LGRPTAISAARRRAAAANVDNHSEAHKKGEEGKTLHAAEKEAKIQDVLQGGSQSPDAFSTEEGLQHAGGVKGEEGTQGTIIRDPSASFAMGNQDFIRQYAKQRAQKASKPQNLEDIGQYNESAKKDVAGILGPAAPKDPQVEKFFNHHYPLIRMSAGRTLKRLGLDPKSPDVDHGLLETAGMHGLFQAINDYDHDSPSKASFATHAGNKIRGLQMTAMKSQDQIPSEIRQAQKKFSAADAIKQSGHPAANDMADRLKRVETYRQAQQVKKASKPPTGGSSGNI
jgi:hypothetical protein